jgi:hypothetical protein
VKELKDKVAVSKKEHEDALLRIEVLREKRQQLYYQAKKSLEQLEPGIIEDRLIHSINDDIDELKRLKEPKVELRETLLEKINSLGVGEKKEQIGYLIEKVREAEEATIELLAIEANQKGFCREHEHLTEELRNDEPRHNWLHRRIASHREAHEYWQNQLEGSESQEDKA